MFNIQIFYINVIQIELFVFHKKSLSTREHFPRKLSWKSCRIISNCAAHHGLWCLRTKSTRFSKPCWDSVICVFQLIDKTTLKVSNNILEIRFGIATGQDSNKIPQIGIYIYRFLRYVGSSLCRTRWSLVPQSTPTGSPLSALTPPSPAQSEWNNSCGAF